MDIELLVIPECPNADGARELIEAALSDLCIHDVAIRTTVLATPQEASARGFAGSPTILLDGRDPFPTRDAQAGLACRVYSTSQGLRGVPELREMRQALKEALA